MARTILMGISLGDTVSVILNGGSKPANAPFMNFLKQIVTPTLCRTTIFPLARKIGLFAN